MADCNNKNISNCRLQFTDCVEHFALDWKVVGLAELVAENLVEEG